MHELAATAGMLTAALEQMRDVGAARVTGLDITIGVSGHFTEGAVRQHFALLAHGTPAAGAQLRFMWLPATYQCFVCLHRFASADAPTTVTCPLCGGVALEIAHQEVYYVSAIEVAFASEVPASATPAQATLEQ